MKNMGRQQKEEGCRTHSFYNFEANATLHLRIARWRSRYPTPASPTPTKPAPQLGLRFPGGTDSAVNLPPFVPGPRAHPAWLAKLS